MIWLRAVFGLRIRPASIAETTRAIRSRPRSLSIRDFDELRGERRRCTVAAAGFEVRSPVGGDLVKVVASQYLGEALARGRVVDKMNAAVGAADIG